MKLTEMRDVVVTGAMEVKEKACRKHPSDISNTVDVFRGGEPVATIMLRQTGQSNVHLVEAFRFAATGYEADQIATMVEGFTAGPNLDPPGINPVTGDEIGNTTLSNLFYDHDGAGKGWVRECLYVQVYNRAGDMIAARLPYHYVGGRHLVWDGRENLPEDMVKQYGIDADDLVAAGAMDEAMQRLMNDVPSFSQVFPGLVTETTSRAELDVVVTDMIQRRLPCTIILWAHQGGEREETIRNRMRRDH